MLHSLQSLLGKNYTVVHEKHLVATPLEPCRRYAAQLCRSGLHIQESQRIVVADAVSARCAIAAAAVPAAGIGYAAAVVAALVASALNGEHVPAAASAVAPVAAFAVVASAVAATVVAAGKTGWERVVLYVA